WQESHFYFRFLLVSPLELPPAAASQSGTRFLLSPALCRRFPRWHYWHCLFRCHFSESAYAPQLPLCFSTGCSRLFATPRPVCRIFPRQFVNPLLPSGWNLPRVFGRFICQWLPVRC